MSKKDCLNRLKPPTVHKRKVSNRQIKNGLHGETAAKVIGPLYPGCEIYGFTKGHFHA